MTRGFVLDTGVLIGLERRKMDSVEAVRRILERGDRVTVPLIVVAEFSRGNIASTSRVLRALRKDGAHFEPLIEATAIQAGQALAEVKKGPSLSDAIVMATAALRGDVVMTGDINDMMTLQSYFRAVRFVGVGRVD